MQPLALSAHTVESPHVLLSGMLQVVAFTTALQVPWNNEDPGTERREDLIVRPSAADRCWVEFRIRGLPGVRLITWPSGFLSFLPLRPLSAHPCPPFSTSSSLVWGTEKENKPFSCLLYRSWQVRSQKLFRCPVCDDVKFCGAGLKLNAFPGLPRWR